MPPSMPPEMPMPTATSFAPAQPIPTVIDARSLFSVGGRLSRPRRLVILLRGLPGAGKSTLARLLRDAETSAGGEAPRLHSIDEYFLTGDDAKYVHDASSEAAYRASMERAVARTVSKLSALRVVRLR